MFDELVDVATTGIWKLRPFLFLSAKLWSLFKFGVFRSSTSRVVAKPSCWNCATTTRNTKHKKGNCFLCWWLSCLSLLASSVLDHARSILLTGYRYMVPLPNWKALQDFSREWRRQRKSIWHWCKQATTTTREEEGGVYSWVHLSK